MALARRAEGTMPERIFRESHYFLKIKKPVSSLLDITNGLIFVGNEGLIKIFKIKFLASHGYLGHQSFLWKRKNRNSISIGNI